MYLGLDLGTSGLKALLLDEQGSPVSTVHVQCDVSNPKPGWSEQDPDAWVRACEQIFDQIPIERRKRIRAISLSGHMHGAVTVNTEGRPLRPCILWNDTRSAEQSAYLDGIAEVRTLSGNAVFPGFTAPKLMWMAKHEPELFAKIHKVLLPKDYVLHYLTGRFATDVSDASGTSWLNVQTREWSDVLLSHSGMRKDQMPDLLEGTDIVGTLRGDVCEKYDLSPNVKIIAGGADNAVSACGVGVINEGQGLVSLGTSGVLLVGKNSYSASPETAVHSFCAALPNRWYQMGVILSATNSLNWLAGVLDQSPKQLDALVDGLNSGPNHCLFVPYLSGERTPHNDVDIGGAFIGLTIETTPRDMVQSVMEGVSYALRDCVEALRAANSTCERLIVIGGGSNSTFWLQTLANIIGLPIDIPEKGDFGAALGAARLAMIGDGHNPHDILLPPTIELTIAPDETLRGVYEAGYQRFRKAYPLLKQLS